eukprot:scaffold2351_cov403-Prasinococcus_capsulatus_cf.AAC.2
MLSPCFSPSLCFSPGPGPHPPGGPAPPRPKGLARGLAGVPATERAATSRGRGGTLAGREEFVRRSAFSTCSLLMGFCERGGTGASSPARGPRFLPRVQRWRVQGVNPRARAACHTACAHGFETCGLGEQVHTSYGFPTWQPIVNVELSRDLRER